MPRHCISIAFPRSLQEEILGQDLVARLEEVADVTRWPGEAIAPGDWRTLLGDASILVTGWRTPPVKASDLNHAERLRLIAHTAGSVKALLPAESFASGVEVVSAASAMAPAVAELALISTMMLLRRPQAYDVDLHAGRPTAWGSASGEIMGREVGGTKIGVVGASRTGRAYIGMVRCLGAEVRVADPYLDERDAQRLGVTLCSLEELLEWSGVLSLHAPLTDQTQGMIGADELSLLRDGAILINTARAGLIDADALTAELSSGRIFAAIDAHHQEPLPADHPHRRLGNVLLFPHMGAATRDSRRRQGVLVVEEIERFIRGEPLRHRVEAERLHVLA